MRILQKRGQIPFLSDHHSEEGFSTRRVFAWIETAFAASLFLFLQDSPILTGQWVNGTLEPNGGGLAQSVIDRPALHP
jgi:hypothetical protein